MDAPSGRSILITGCSSGIGLSAVRTLTKRGWRVFATCRKEDDCERLRGEGFESYRIDLEDTPTIGAGVQEAVKRTGGTLEAVFNNGAYAIPGALEDVPVEAMRAIFEANLFGWHELTRHALPVMRAQGRGRIVQNSSILGFIPLPLHGPYCSTKFAVEGWSDVLRLELRETDIHVSLIEPGPISTKFRENARIQFERWIDREKSSYQAALNREAGRLNQPELESKYTLPAEAVVEKLIHAVESSRPRARYYVTRPTYMLGAIKRVTSSRVLDWVLARAEGTPPPTIGSAAP